MLFLVDTGADCSLIKSNVLLPDTEVNTSNKARIKGVEGLGFETFGTVKSLVTIGKKKVPCIFQLVGKQLDFPCDGIIGRDFWEKTGAQICYNDKVIRLLGEIIELKSSESRKEVNKHSNEKLKVPKRCEIVAKIPVECKPGITEGIMEKQEIYDGVYVASAIVKINEGKVLTSVLNVNEKEIEIICPIIKVKEIEESSENKLNLPRVNVNIVKKPKDRGEEVLNQLRLEHLCKEERKLLEATCYEFQDIFHLPGDKLSYTNAIKHSIVVEPGTQPINSRPYRLPETQKEEVDRQVKKLIEEGVLEESQSPWNSPMLVVPKKLDASGVQKWRLVIDYRKLNEKTIGDAYPLPDISEILDQLGNSKYFSCVDMIQGYHQIEMNPEDKDKTAFSTKQGHWQYKRLPFGLKTAPSTFQRMMNNVLSGLTGSRCFVFLDDVVLYASSLEEHDLKLREVFERMRKNTLKLQPDKCEFLRREVNYLGHVISENGVKPDPRKIEAVEKFPVPTTTKQLKGFLGLAGYYRRFVPMFSKIAAPLHKLLKKDIKYEWGSAQENAFQSLKQKLMREPILQYPDFSKEFVVTTDASNDGVGAVLSQGQIGKDLPIAYASRSLNKAEKNYSTTEKELLAIVWGIKHFRPYLYGRKFKVVSDHRPLTWIMNIKDPGSRLIRWRLLLEEYDYEIVFKKGSLNTNADALSRAVYTVKKENDDLMNRDNLEINGPLSAEDDEGDEKIKVDEASRKAILYEFHDSPIGGHRGMNKTYEAIKDKYYWPNMKKEIEEYVKRCKSCQLNKLLKPKRKAPMVITTTAKRPFEKCAMDIVGPVVDSDQGNKYILTFQDELSKFMVGIPMPNQEAETVAKQFVSEVILKYGTPSELLTDQGSNFLSELFKNVCKLLKIRKVQTTAFHPESNGGLERSHRVLAEYLRHYVQEDQRNWDLWVPYAMFVYNTTIHTSTGYTPFELLFGHKAEIPSALKSRPEIQYAYDDYANELKSRLQTSHEIARQKLIKHKEKSKEYFDKKTETCIFKPGDLVLLYDETVRRGRSKKLSNKWIGPYEIIQADNVNAVIKKGRKTQKVHVNRLKPFY